MPTSAFLKRDSFLVIYEALHSHGTQPEMSVVC